jgi:tetratricopeptide (TPR) repeat protein
MIRNRILAFSFLLLFSISADSKPNVLLITIDTLRADSLGCYGNSTGRTPNLDSLSRNSLFFKNAIAPAPMTLPSHTSIMTGRYPHHHGIHDNAGIVNPQELTLAEILGQNGYHTYAVIGGFPLEHRFGLNQGFEVYDDHFPRLKNRSLDFRSERSADRVVEALQKIRIQQPFFVWIHFYDPHAPYLHGGYAGEVAFVDLAVGKLLKMIPTENTIVIVAGDHGESLGEHGEMTHRIFVYDSTVKVPFWMRGPNIPAKTVEAQTRLVDLMPTLLKYLQLTEPRNVDGRVLPEGAGQPAQIESRFPELQLGWSPLFAIRTNEWKYVQAPSPELYDLTNDPAEKKNLASSKPDLVTKFQSQIPKEFENTEQAKISPEMAEKLAALGYVGGRSNKRSLRDPKDRIAIWNQIEKAVDLEMSNSSETLKLLEKLNREDPSNPMILGLLAQKYSDAGNHEKSKSYLKSILKEDPQNTLALFKMADVCLKLGKPGEARQWAEALLKTGQNNVEGLQLLARSNIAIGDLETAAFNLNDLIKLDPRDLEARNDLGNVYFQSGNLEEAKESFQSVLRIDPLNIQAMNGLATYYFSKNDFDTATAYLKKASQIDPKDIQTRMNHALVLSRQGKTAEASALYRDLIASADTPADWKEQARNLLKELQK